MTSAAWWRSSLIRRRRSSLTWGCMRFAASRAGVGGDCYFRWPDFARAQSDGPVADIFTEDVLSKIRGTLAIGHTRYSTAGDSALLNAQPILVQSNKGSIAVAHNGNL
jgi:glutamine phosphoribosylpyrophosphate amidotransferase